MRRWFTPRPRTLFCALWFIGLSSPALAANQDGKALRVIDGDTIQLGADRIRLDGIDAPELAQTCLTSAGKSWPCGKTAKAYLERMASAGKVTCDGNEVDLYGRKIATCHARGRNLNAEMIRAGQALAFRRYSTAYAHEEDLARRDQQGLWAGYFDAPWDYRAKKWHVASQAVPKDCPIKGNITARGKIYHAPWSPHYARTRINEAKGERWFCSEAEALAAGWRAPD
jgi:endonuclease YncB( thermonuclease family)